MQQNLAVEVLMELTGISLHALRKQRVQGVQALGSKGECKVSEFLRGSYSLWLTDEDKEDISYGAGRDHSFGMVVNIH